MTSFDKVTTVDADAVFRLFTACPTDIRTLIIDVRDKKKWDKGHIAGSYCIRKPGSGDTLLGELCASSARQARRCADRQLPRAATRSRSPPTDPALCGLCLRLRLLQGRVRLEVVGRCVVEQGRHRVRGRQPEEGPPCGRLPVCRQVSRLRPEADACCRTVLEPITHVWSAERRYAASDPTGVPPGQQAPDAGLPALPSSAAGTRAALGCTGRGWRPSSVSTPSL